jgi:DNA-binding Lrp family transcriptional regulator
MKNWIGIQELMDKTGTSRDALRYHIESLEKNGFIQSRTVKWKTTYKKEYLALPLEVFIHVDRDAGSLPGETAPTQEREDV